MNERKDDLKRTPLFEAHVTLGARLVPFAGWEMPLQYTSILDEARAVRTRCGIFDISHMGRVIFTGSGAASFLHSILTADVLGLQVGRARYSLVCNEEGGIIDDTLVYRWSMDRFMLVPNAANTPAVLKWVSLWISDHPDAQFQEVTHEYSMIAFQGPDAINILEKLCPISISSLRPFGCIEAQVSGRDVLLSRTGYTGEDGVELILSREHAAHLWGLLIERGAKPCGLGARDVLRLEAGLLLHGSDMDVSINPFEAGLERFVKANEEGFIAGRALAAIRVQGVSKRLVGFDLAGRNIPRHGYPILDGQKQIGGVTSGGYSPTLDKNIGLGYVPQRYSTLGSQFQIDIRGRVADAMVAHLPFYSRLRGA
ncbi:MAG: glycine cleavage system aminomethyltransferase GcvT [Chloroflexi bacterium]|nr:glycine cleavage system aminomethyltransferase GcvT [Chloroflexota bacterium]